MTADEVREARDALGMTNRQLASCLGLDGEHAERTVRRWVHGQVPITGPAATAIQLMLRLKGLGEHP